MRRINLLGSTGSIGTQALKLIREDEELQPVSLSARSNIALLKEQIYEFRPKLVCVFEEAKKDELAKILSSEGVLSPSELPKLVSGMDGLCEAASFSEGELTLIALVGMIGIEPTLAAIESGKDIALANKETLVCAGHIIMPLIKEKGIRLTPIDSEHSAIYQCLMGEEHDSIDKIYLTASGGPFRGKKTEELRDVKASDALKHPNWSMGAKITIDSATMVNKALEVMEAHWLFDVDIDDIVPVIQPKSVIHSMVGFKDGAVKAQLGAPTMLVPIAFSLYAPRRVKIKDEPELDFKLCAIEFDEPDYETFKGLSLGIEAGKTGGLMPTVFNAANEEAVALFLDEKIGFLDIADGIESAMRHFDERKDPDIALILNTEKRVRAFIRDKFALGS